MLGAAEPATWRNGINRRSLAIQGSLGLIRFILRRDRLYLPLWIVAVVIVNVAYATQMSDFLGDDASRQALLEMLKNPAMVAMMGVSYGTEIGQLYAQFMLIWAAALAAVFNIMLVIRHTRKDEEEGRLEMLSSLPLGRNAQLAATLAVALLADLLIAGFSSACFAAIDIQGIGAGGGAVMSFAVAATGFAFAGLAAFVAQLCATAKVANALAFVALGAAYLLRAMGDVANEALALASPLGLAERVQAWAANLAWPIAVLAAEGLAFFALAFVFSSLRDANAGILPARLGRRHASPWLAGDLGLAWRLTRSLSIGW
ncbi:MAG: ABC transporter permease, partial [Actinomycetia bacterium]|nr:ABC transporter permease [Actinomycetes bacterium]